MARPSVLISMMVNGRLVEVATPPHHTLLEVLREQLDLIGTKQGCDKGDCGACTVQLDGVPTLSCLTLALQAQGREVTTVEGLDGRPPHPLLTSFADWGAAQCGFCTPGVLMSAEALLRDTARPVSKKEVSVALSGNLCRCTGYTKILDAVVDASEQLSASADAAEADASVPQTEEG